MHYAIELFHTAAFVKEKTQKQNKKTTANSNDGN